MKTNISFLIISRLFLLRIRNISDKSCKENQIKYFMYRNIPFFFENRTVYQKMWDNSVEPGNPQTTVRSMSTVCRIPKATNTHSQYIILIASPLKQWLQERPSMLRLTYIVCLALYYIFILVLRFFYVDPLFYFIFPYLTFHLTFRVAQKAVQLRLVSVYLFTFTKGQCGKTAGHTSRSDQHVSCQIGFYL